MILQHSRYRGVRPSGDPEFPWLAVLKVKGVPMTTAGPFATDVEAALTFDAFRRSRGPCRPCRLNFPNEADAPGRIPKRRRTQAPIPDGERREVLDACREILADGVYPSVARLAKRFPRTDLKRLARIRDEAAEAGLIVLGPAGGHGLLGITEAERKEVKKRTKAIRKEKVARGEVARPVEMRVIRDRQYDTWFVGRR